MRTPPKSWFLFGLGLASLFVVGDADAKKKGAAAAPKQASAETAAAIGDLAGKWKWGLSGEEVLKMVITETEEKFDEKIKAESSPFKQDAIRKKLNDSVERIKENFVKFDGHKTGWDVSLIDREYSHNNNESMLVISEEGQRRFLFFYENKLWKQFIAFNADVFAGKTFDDFGNAVQKRFGPAATTFKKQRSNDDQTFDHLEWPPAGDFTLWAIDMTTLYNNFCLSLFQKSKVEVVEKGRREKNPRRGGNALVDMVTKPGGDPKTDSNSDIVDQITGRNGTSPPPESSTPPKKK